MDNILKELLQQESELQLQRFSEDTAWQLGTQLMEIAQAENLPVTIDITRGVRQIFHASRPGACADNDEWVKRKVRLVYRMEHSSFYIGQLIKSEDTSIEEKFLLSESEFAPHGGSFPVIVKGTGVVGTVTVSGLAQEDDHALVVRALREFLRNQ